MKNFRWCSMIGENICRSNTKSKTCDKKTVRPMARQTVNSMCHFNCKCANCTWRVTFPITAWTGFKPTILVVIATDCIGNCKSNYHTITTMTAPNHFFKPLSWQHLYASLSSTSTGISWSFFLDNNIHMLPWRGCRARDPMIVGFTTTYMSVPITIN